MGKRDKMRRFRRKADETCSVVYKNIRGSATVRSFDDIDARARILVGWSDDAAALHPARRAKRRETSLPPFSGSHSFDSVCPRKRVKSPKVVKPRAAVPVHLTSFREST